MSACTECPNSSPGSTACRKCYTYHYLLPHLERELRELGILIAPLIPPIPGPDPLLSLNVGLVERDLVHAFLGGPDPESKVFARNLRLSATLSFRKSLADTVGSLDREIETLQSTLPPDDSYGDFPDLLDHLRAWKSRLGESKRKAL